jgi:hypothetical protein
MGLRSAGMGSAGDCERIREAAFVITDARLLKLPEDSAETEPFIEDGFPWPLTGVNE